MQRKIVPDIVNDQAIATLSPDATVHDAATIIAERHIGALLVGTVDNMQGIFTERDIASRVVAKGRDPNTTKVSEVMTPNPDTVGPDASVLEALELMSKGGYRHLPVHDGSNLLGIVSIRDLYKAVKDQLEEDLLEREAFISGVGQGGLS